MDPSSVLSKTPKGVEEIETRKHRLDHRLRALLIVVNGKTRAADIAAKFEQLGDVMPLLRELAVQGFVTDGAAPAARPAAVAAPAAPARAAASGLVDYKRAILELSMHLRDALGPDADSLTSKLEACGSMEEVREFLDARRDMLDEWLGRSKAVQFWMKAKPLVG